MVDHALPKLGRVTRLGRGGLALPLGAGAARPRDEDVDDAKTVVAHRLSDIGRDDELDDDPATARAPDHPAFTAARGAPRPFDPETVQLSRVPLSFIAEATGDPATLDAAAVRPDARWRDENGVDELPPGPLPPGPLPSAVPDQSSPTLARGERPERSEGSEPDPSTESGGIDLRTAILIPILGGAVLGVLSVTLILAFIAGWLAM